jgi:hypothetical protein
MSYLVTKPFPHGVFCWSDVQSKDMNKTKAFMTGLLGWTFEDMPTPMGVDYTMFSLDGHNVAGGNPMSPDDKAPGSYWVNYISVEHLEATVEKAVSLGATVIMPSMDVMDSGRMAGIMDPTGAAIMFWEAKSHIGAGIVNTTGAMCWNELLTHDVEKAQKFYTDLFGWTYEKDERDYYMIKLNGRMNGGMMKIKEEWGPMPASWVVYFTVADLAASMVKVKELGGQIMGDVIDAGATGKIASVIDPNGAYFNLIQMSVPPEEWVE